MTATNFEACLRLTRLEEGGNDDDPHDHGGRTSRGITKAEWDKYRSAHPELPADVWEAPDTAVNSIYHEQYWMPYCDKLPSGLDLCFFDFGVNAGQRRAAISLQRVLGVAADGHIGMETLTSVQETDDLDGLIHRYCESRRAFYRALKQFPRYGKGWMARTGRIERAAIKMSKQNPPTPETGTVSPRADARDINEPIASPATSGAATAGSATLTGAVTQVQQSLQDYQSVKIIGYICLAITIGLALYTIYSWWKRNRMQEIAG